MFKATKFKQRCQEFHRYKGMVQPRCSCSSCWSFYFYKNPGRLLAGKMAIELLGAETVINAQGSEFYEATRFERFAPLKSLTDAHATDRRLIKPNKEAIIRNRGEKYLKHITAYLKANPIPQEQPEEIFDAVA